MVRGFGGVFEPEPQLWVGVDELLNRRVGVDLIATEHPLVEQVARAARDAAAVPDARFVQVLDAVQDEDLLYIVTEWVPGAEQLQERLADGPLSPARATDMVRDLAEAMVRAHEAEVTHGAMNPATVMITKAGEVKLRGLLVEATLSGADPESAEPEKRYAADVLALGQIWYAALTARWPGSEAEYGLDAAPTDSAALYTPAQIRAAVPKQVDATVCRALGLGEQESFTHGQGAGGRDPLAAQAAREVAGGDRRRPAAAHPQRQAGGATLELRRRRQARRRALLVPRARRTHAGLAPSRRAGGRRLRDRRAGHPRRIPAQRERQDQHHHRQHQQRHAAPVRRRPGEHPGRHRGQGADRIASDSVWDQSPSQGSQSSAANAYNGSTAGWKMTTQYDANWASENAGGIGLVFNLGSRTPWTRSSSSSPTPAPRSRS